MSQCDSSNSTDAASSSSNAEDEIEKQIDDLRNVYRKNDDYLTTNGFEIRQKSEIHKQQTFAFGVAAFALLLAANDFGSIVPNPWEGAKWSSILVTLVYILTICLVVYYYYSSGNMTVEFERNKRLRTENEEANRDLTTFNVQTHGTGSKMILDRIGRDLYRVHHDLVNDVIWM